MYFSGGMNCCGMDEIMELQDDEGPLVTAFKHLLGSSNPAHFPAIVVFSAVIKPKHKAHYAGMLRRGHAFARFLKDNKLGTVVSARPQINLNTGNIIKAWLWTVNREALAAWHKKNPLTKGE